MTMNKHDRELKYQFRLEQLHSKQQACQHVFQKTIAKSGMWFIDLCHKCMYEQPKDLKWF